MDLTMRRVLTASATTATGLVLMQLGRVLAPVEDGAGIAWSVIGVMVAIAAAGSAGGIDPSAVWEWVVRHRAGLVLLVAPWLLSSVLVLSGVETASWLTVPTPLGALGLGLALAGLPLSRASRPRPRPAHG